MDLNSTSPSALKWIHVDASEESPDSDCGAGIRYGTVRLDGTVRNGISAQ